MKRDRDKDDDDVNVSDAGGGDMPTMHFPALRAFMRSYLHQDFGEEYGSVEEAVRTFCEDANRDEVAAVAKEWRGFLEATKGRSLTEINNLLSSKLGSAWNATKEDELSQISAALQRCDAGGRPGH